MQEGEGVGRGGSRCCNLLQDQWQRLREWRRGVRRLPQGQPERRRQAVGLAVAAALLPRYSTSVASRPQTAAKLIQ